MMRDEDGGAVYRMFDADDALLYVGSSGDAQKRIQQHLGTLSQGIPEAAELRRRYARHTVSYFPTLTAARDAERLAIQAEAPLLNVRHNRARVTA